MKNLALVFAVILASISHSFAQDKLLFLDGKEQEVKITEVSSSEVKYKRLDNLEGPMFSVLKSELFMIKYANGSKEVIEHTAAAPEPVQAPPQAQQPVQNQPVQSQPALSQPTPAQTPSGNSGLSSGVKVEEGGSQSNQIRPEVANRFETDPTRDSYGRTKEENLRLRRKRLVGGGVAMGIGGAALITGTVFLVQGIRFDNTFASDPRYADHPGHNYALAGGLVMAAGFGVTIVGAGLLGSSRKYKKRAAELADSGFDLSPTILNDFQYAGAKVNSSAGYGFRLTYDF